ncbi:hypothetical protein B0H21DRAFT_143570 [Amylocystis lapponica]|nr:hypothetical protein B0H21DRAFT_143570 [Amylocystis lapponica]
MAFPSLRFIFEFYDVDDPPLLPTRLERVRLNPSRAPTLPPDSYKAITHGDWDLTRAMSTHNHTKEEEVHALGQDLLDTILNPTWVDFPMCCAPKAYSCATNGSSQLQSPEPGTALRSPAPRWNPKHRDRSDRSSILSTSSSMDCLESPIDLAAKSPTIHSDAETADIPICINIDACVLEAKQLGWRHQWRIFIRQRAQLRLQARDDLLRDEHDPSRAVTPDRLGAWPPFVEA